MPKLFCIIPIVNGRPDLDPVATPCHGYVLADRVGGFGAYLVSGTGPQLVAINALASVVGIVAVTESGQVRWAELDGAISAGVRNKLNTWLTARGFQNIPAGWSLRQVVLAVFQRVNDRFDLDQFDVAEN